MHNLTFPFLPKRLYCVIGWPLDQSLSPLLHNTGFQTLGLDAIYLQIPVCAQDLPRFLDSVRLLPISGCSVTIPHKTAIIPFLDSVSDRAQQIGAVNTLYWRDQKLVGENTDCAGFLAPLANVALNTMTVLLLGAGGAARACLRALQERQTKKVFIATPSNTRQIALAEEFAAEPILWQERYDVHADLIVNATPLGMHGSHEHETPYDFAQSSCQASLAYDIVYNPRETRFLREAARHGLSCLSGQTMFFEQGNAQFHLWTGQNLPEEAQLALHQALASNA